MAVGGKTAFAEELERPENWLLVDGQAAPLVGVHTVLATAPNPAITQVTHQTSRCRPSAGARQLE